MTETEREHPRRALASALGEVLAAEQFDLVEDAAGALEAMTDEWTLRIEGWPDGIAYLTIDDEPGDVTEMRRARRAVMPVAVERALALADRELGGGLALALRASADPLSIDLAQALAEHQTDT
jgi:hypothetical protein